MGNSVIDAAKPPKPIELTLTCSYTVNASKKSEVEALTATETDPVTKEKRNLELWNPSNDDFKAVAETPGLTRREVRQVANVGQLIDAITKYPNKKPRPAQSVCRVNIIGHGEPSLIGLLGTVDYDSGNVYFEPENTANYLTGMAFGLATARWLEKDEEGITYTNSIKKVLTLDAEIALITCHSGQLDGGLLMDRMVALFGCKLLGYKEAIFYHPKLNASQTAVIERRITKIDRGGTEGLGYCCRLPAKLDGKHLQYTAHRLQ